MKIKKVITVLMISFSLLFTNALSNVFAYENENYNINYVDNIEEFKVDLKEEKSKNKINFYVDNKFQNSTARKNKINTFENMKD